VRNCENEINEYRIIVLLNYRPVGAIMSVTIILASSAFIEGIHSLNTLSIKKNQFSVLHYKEAIVQSLFECFISKGVSAS